MTNWDSGVTPPPIAENGDKPGKDQDEPPVVEGANLRITGKELCWVRATVDGELIPDTMLQPGEVRYRPREHSASPGKCRWGPN